jgi:hypothetical protein
MVDGRSRRRRNHVQKKPSPATKVEDVPNELLELVFLRLTSPVDLVRAAFTCRRWRSVIAADGFRVLGSLHGAPPSHVAGHYRVEERLHASRLPGRKPVFVPSSSSPWAGIIAARNLALDFLPPAELGGFKYLSEYIVAARNFELDLPPQKYFNFFWELTDVRGGLLLLLEPPPQPRLVICDPLARRYKAIPHSAWFHGCEFLGAFLLDGESGARISLSNFKVTCALYYRGIARACAFSSAGGGRWTSGNTAVCSTRYRRGIRFAGCSDDGSVAQWTLGNRIILALDKEAAELSSYTMPDEVEYAALEDKRHVPEYAYDLPWPPMIRACLS